VNEDIDPKNCPCALTEHEWQVLEMVAGQREIPWGSWVGACIEFLQDYGLVTRGMEWKLTERGEMVFKNRKVFT